MRTKFFIRKTEGKRQLGRQILEE